MPPCDRFRETVSTVMISRLQPRNDAKEDCHWSDMIVGPAGGECHQLELTRGPQIQAALAFDFATCVAIASIRAGDRQSYGSSPSSLRRARIPVISEGSTPDSMTEDTKAANVGAAQPPSSNSSGCMKSRP